MKLPNYENVLVEERKIKNYLLDEEKSGGKALFFTAFGFTLEQWQVLRVALISHVANHDVARSTISPHGIKYIIEGEIQTPDGRLPWVRSVWIVDTGKDVPRLVTAYPLKEEM